MKKDDQLMNAVLMCLWNMETHIMAKAEQISLALQRAGMEMSPTLVLFYARLAEDQGLLQQVEGNYWRLTWSGHEHAEMIDGIESNPL